MATLREIRRRIRSIKSTAQITKAMELVAASQMRRAQDRVLAARPYAEKMQSVLGDLSSQMGSNGRCAAPLAGAQHVGQGLPVVLTSDRGLCGGFNTNIVRHALEFIIRQRNAGEEVVDGHQSASAVAMP